MNYSTILKDLRKEKNITQKEIADILGIERITYNHYETQEKIIPIERLVQISEFYKVSIDYIFGLTNIKNYTDNTYTINKELTKLRIRNIRKENKLTQEALAKLLNVSRTTITEYERGTNIIATPFLYTVCRNYNVSADYLLGKIEKSQL